MNADAATIHKLQPHLPIIEKIQVRLAIVLALAAGYWLLWPMLAPPDPQGPVAFLPHGRLGELALLAAGVWAMTALAGAITLFSRCEAAMLGGMAVALGVACHSGSAGTLLQYNVDRLPATFRELSAETAAMAAVAAGAAVVAHMVQRLLRPMVPDWVRRSEPAAIAAPTGAKAKAAGKDAPVKASRLVNYGGALLMQLVIALPLLTFLCRDTARGQVLFALGASFFLAAMATHQVFPVRPAAMFWLPPLLVGTLVLAMGGQPAEPGPDWYLALMVRKSVPLRAALPIDWLAAGAGGGLLGLWVSLRIHDNRRQEDQQ